MTKSSFIKSRKLLIVTTVPITIKAFLLPIARFLRQNGWHVDAMASGVTALTELHDEFDNLHEASWTRSPFSYSNYTATKEIQQVCKEQCYDIVHVHTPIASLVTRVALANYSFSGRPKVIYTAHGFHFHSNGGVITNFVYKQIEKWAGKYTDRLVVINREDEMSALELNIVKKERLVYMPGIGVDTGFYNPKSISPEKTSKLKEELGLASDRTILSMVAEFNPGKRHEDVIDALMLLDVSDVHVVFAGTGILEDKLKKKVADLGIENQVHFLGYCDDVITVIGSSTATILSSEREGLPRCVLESISLGIPVIGAKARGTVDLLDNGVGMLYEIGNIQELADCMKKICFSNDLVESLSKESRKASKNYDISKIVEMHLDLYNSVGSVQLT